jgi:hypoxanthine phosphoribosyltransferase
VVDDLVDSGVTLAEVVAELSRAYPAVTKVCTAVLWYKAVSSFKPDFFVHFLPTNPWIHQPFEVYDHQRPQDLALSRAKELS